MTDEQHISAGHVRVVSNDKMCFWVEPGTYEPLTNGCYDPWCVASPLPCENISLSAWQDARATMSK